MFYIQLLYLNEDIKNNYLKDINSNEVQIDKDIKNYINIINSLPYICTTQCCQGHPDNGYLSVMITEDKINWFESIIIKEIFIYCKDVIKRFEEIKKDQIYVRYTFWFKNLEFFNAFINLLK